MNNPYAQRLHMTESNEIASIVLSANNIHKTYSDGQKQLSVLKAVDIRVAAGERVAVVGASGSGKSTLLHVLAGLDNPSSGRVLVQEQNIHELSHAKRGRLRNRAIGFVYQFHHLMPELTAAENVELPLRVARVSATTARRRAQEWLHRVGLGHRLDHRPAQLSGGERQRCAVARALVTEPAIVLADEPTGSLDRNNAESVSQLMHEINREHGTAFLIATHDVDLAATMDRQIVLEAGEITAGQI